MLNVGLTGGIGAGKSAVLAGFARLGATVIDADDVARDVVEPGTSGLARVVEAFGSGVVDSSGRLDRAALAALVFAGSERSDALTTLEAILHPLVRDETRRRVAALPAGTIVVNAVPLLVEAGWIGEYDAVVVVEAPLDVRLGRLVESRRMTRDDALARIAAQADDEQRRAVAWRVIVNDGSLDELAIRVDEVWNELVLLTTGWD